MVDISIPLQQNSQDIFNLGFDKTLNKIQEPIKSNVLVYDAINNEITSQNILRELSPTSFPQFASLGLGGININETKGIGNYTTLLMKNLFSANASQVDVRNDKTAQAILEAGGSAISTNNLGNSRNNAVSLFANGADASLMMVGSIANIDLVFGTNNVERFRITAAGAFNFSGFTANSFVYSGTGGGLTSTAASTNGQLLIGSTGLAPSVATLTAGSNITITNGAGAITIAAAGISGLTTNGAVYAASATTIASTAALTNGQMLIGSTGLAPVAAVLTAGTAITITNGAGAITIANNGVTSAIGTANQVNVSGATGAVTFSLPQSIATSSTPQFSRLGLGVAADANLALIATNTTGGATAEIARLTNTGAQLGRGLKILGSSAGFIGIQGIISAGGADDHLVLSPSSGSVMIGASAALATTATDGFLYIPTSAGAPTGVPTTQVGKVAIEYDTTNNKLYVYNGGWKSVALL